MFNPKEKRAVQFRLESLHKRTVALMFISVTILFLLLIIGGHFGPSPYHQAPAKKLGWLKHQEWKKELSGPRRQVSVWQRILELKSFNGEWWLYLKPIPNIPDKREFNIRLAVRAFHNKEVHKNDQKHWVAIRNSTETTSHRVTCDKNNCTKITIMHGANIPDEVMIFEVLFPLGRHGNNSNARFLKNMASLDTKFEYSNYNFWVFELIFRSIYAFISAVVLILYLMSIVFMQDGVRWATEQKGVLLLLIALFCFNNPLFVGSMLDSSFFFPTFDMLAIAFYICTLLFIVLVFTHRVYLKDKTHRRLSFYGWKLLLIVPLFIDVAAFLIWTRRNLTKDPTNTDHMSTTAFTIFYLVTALLTIAYLGWLMFLVIRVASEWKNLSFYSSRFKYLWGLTVVVIFFTAACLVMWTYERYNAEEFILIWTLYNFFTYILAFLFSPSPHFQTLYGAVDLDDFDEEDTPQVQEEFV